MKTLTYCLGVAGIVSMLAGNQLNATEGPPFVTPASAPVPGIIEVGSIRQTFLDDRVLHEASKISKFVARPTKYAKNPVIVADRPWEQGLFGYKDEKRYPYGIQITGQSVLYDEEEKIFKMWYLPWSWPDGRRPWCYAISKDGYRWEKPSLRLFEYQGSKENNILLSNGPEDAGYFNVIKDPQ